MGPCLHCPGFSEGRIIEQIMTPKIKNGTTVVFGMVVLLINKKYTRGTVNKRSKVIPIAKPSGFERNNEVFASSIIAPIISNGIPRINKVL